MLSRVANSIYWMARYVERAENLARFNRCHAQLDLGTSEWIGGPVGTTGQHHGR